MNKNKEYFFIDLNTSNNKIVHWGVSNTATLTGETDKKDIHRIFLTKGQYNKVLKFLK